MKGRIFVSLFALPFFGVGVWMAFSVGSMLVDAWRMDSWIQVEARLLSGGYEAHSGDDSDTYEAYAAYTYTVQGRQYSGDRVGLSSGADNIGDYQRDIGRNLQQAAASGQAILVYVDPESPSDAVIDRGVRWGLLGFKSIFLFVFGGVGLFLLIAAWRAPKAKDKTLPQYQDSPWLLDDDWKTPSIRSSSKNSMFFAWGFAAIWNLISAPLPFVLYGEIVDKENYLAIVGALFPIVGMGLLVWAIIRTREWLRFGKAPVTLDPFPGSIGGHVGGTIDLNTPFDAATRFKLSLTNVRSYISGSGKNRSRREEAEWQDSIVAHAAPSASGTRLTFRFDVPAGLEESDTGKDDSYYLWRLNLSAAMAGADLDRDYEIPVYATASSSRFLPEYAVQEAHTEQQAVDDESIRKVFDLSRDSGGKRMLYPAGRHIGSSIGALVVGAVFAVAGWFLIVQESAAIFGSIFGGVGALIAIMSLYMMLNSLEVTRDHSGIRTTRRVLGVPVSRKHMALHEFVRLNKNGSFKSRTGSKHVIHYTIQAVDKAGRKLTVGEGFTGENEARAAMRLIADEFGLRQAPEHGDSRDSNQLLGPEVLS